MMVNDSVAVTIGGRLDSQDGGSAGGWEFVYRPSSQAVSLEVSPVKNVENKLSCEFNKADIDGLIVWLQNIQHKLSD
ncbi:hypothetical protein QP938_12225 [Porticoccaceae bacterium LTM1]|nr:hypothetical protein QP938_12225 [Porticoccaceae bacterium LTM1]